VPFVRFADGEEFEFDHLDSHDRPVFFGDRASPRVWAANIAFTLAGLGLGIGVVANLQALGGFVSGFLATVAPTLHL
jgi:hypothetical protein